MRVAQITVRLVPGLPGWGGAPQVAIDLAKALALKGVNISIFAINAKNEPHCDVQGKRLTAYTFPEDKSLIMRWWPFYAPALAKALVARVPDHDIIHVHEIWHYPGYAAYNTAKKADKPYIVTVHGALEPWCLNHKAFKKSIYAALIQRRILNEAAAIHAVTQEEVENIRGFGVDAPVVVIPNGIEPAKFEALPSLFEIERLYPELRGKKVLLFLGRIHPKKGLDILARAFGHIARSRKDLHLLIVGPDNDGYRSQVERLLESEMVIERTTFTGMLTERWKLAALSRADICAIPSYSEGMSIVVLEAMACGLPVVITRQCHFPEVAEAKAGIIIEPNADQLADALNKLLDDQKLCKEMGENGRRLIMEKFTWDKIADQMIRLYENVLGKI